MFSDYFPCILLFNKMITHIKLHIFYACLYHLAIFSVKNYISIGTKVKFKVWSYHDSFLLYVSWTPLLYLEIFFKKSWQPKLILSLHFKTTENIKISRNQNIKLSNFKWTNLGLCTGSLYLVPYYWKPFCHVAQRIEDQGALSLVMIQLCLEQIRRDFNKQ